MNAHSRYLLTTTYTLILCSFPTIACKLMPSTSPTTILAAASPTHPQLLAEGCVACLWLPGLGACFATSIGVGGRLKGRQGEGNGGKARRMWMELQLGTDLELEKSRYDARCEAEA